MYSLIIVRFCIWNHRWKAQNLTYYLKKSDLTLPARPAPLLGRIRYYRLSNNMSSVTGKCALRSLSLSYQKKDWRVVPRLRNIICEGSRVQFHSWCHTQRTIGRAPANPSLGMATTKILRHIFSWHSWNNTENWLSTIFKPTCLICVVGS